MRTRTARFEVSAPVDWRIEGALTRRRSTTHDISDGGVLIPTLELPRIGAAVEIVLGQRGIVLRGTVARADLRGVAVELADPESGGRRRLRRQLRTAKGRESLGLQR